MLIALGCVTLLALALIAFAHSQQRAHQEAQAQWALERRELLNRVQRPELIPVAADRPFVVPEQPPDEWGLVGTINRDADAAADTTGVARSMTPQHLAEELE